MLLQRQQMRPQSAKAMDVCPKSFISCATITVFTLPCRKLFTRKWMRLPLLPKQKGRGFPSRLRAVPKTLPIPRRKMTILRSRPTTALQALQADQALQKIAPTERHAAERNRGDYWTQASAEARRAYTLEQHVNHASDFHASCCTSEEGIGRYQSPGDVE